MVWKNGGARGSCGHGWDKQRPRSKGISATARGSCGVRVAKKGTRHCHALSVMRDSGVSPSGFLYDTMPAPGDGGMGSEGAYLIISATA